ncbi:MAG: SPOR domain-containing protein [Bacteroidetes bacterium]|nr:SPOR domain-containing protein [Bacteroidota bacterium]
MYSLEAGIVDLLMKHNCVVVPGFGGFIGKKIPAKLDIASGILIPPSKQFLFNINLIENDGLVLHYLAAKSAVDYLSAEKFVDQKIEEWKNDLQHGRSVTIPELGIIQKNVNGTMEFTQDAESNLLLQSFGLKELLFVPLEQGVEDEIINSEDHVIVPKKVNLWKYAAAACFIPIAFYSFWLPTQTNVFQSKVISIDDFNPFKENKSVEYQHKDFIYTNAQDKSDDMTIVSSEGDSIANFIYDEHTTIPVRVHLKKKIVEKAKKINQFKPSPSLPIANKAKFKVVVGCFSKMENVENFKAKLMRDGFDATHEKFGTLFRVVIKSTDSMSVASEVVEISRHKGYKGWILKK